MPRRRRCDPHVVEKSVIALVAELLRFHDPHTTGLVALIAILGAAFASPLMVDRRAQRSPWRSSFALAVVLTASVVAAFFAAVASVFPQLSRAVPLGWAASGIAVCFGCILAAGRLQLGAGRSARSTLLAGSLASAGLSCLLFIFMAGIAQPFVVAYDLDAVLLVMASGAALLALGMREGVNPDRRMPRLYACVMVACAVAVETMGSLAATLPFGDWLSAAAQDDHLASKPIVVIVAAEAAMALVLGLTGSLLDNRLAARHRLEGDRFRQLADSTLEGILIHRDGMILDGNQSVASLLEVNLADLRASAVGRFMPPHYMAGPTEAANDAVAAEAEIVTARGERLPVEIVSRPINYGGLPARVTALRDIRERRQTEERIRFLAHHDPLTRLANRAKLHDNLLLALELAKQTQSPIAVLCLDLDGFKGVNDTLGHAAGDQLLCQVAERLRGNLRDSDIVARLGGDEFAILQTSGQQPENAIQVARRLIDCLAPEFIFDGQAVTIGTSIGIAIFPSDGLTAIDLMKHADIALYRAKDQGRGGFCMFEMGMDHDLREKRALEQDLRLALAQESLALHFQPLFDASRRVIAFEALSRWMHPERGLVSPATFIPLAEECGLVGQLGEWVLRTACTEAMNWDDDVRIAVNVSPRQFTRGKLPALVSQVLAETGLKPDRLELEVTEGVLIDNPDQALEILNQLREIGVRLVLDDFGTGYSSLSYLHRFPFHKLKVDRSFVQVLESDVNSRAIVSAIISMSRDLKLDVTAEGVETVDQFELLCDQGCHQLQGFLLGRPIPQAGVSVFLASRSTSEAA